jgi:cell division protein FtsB
VILWIMQPAALSQLFWRALVPVLCLLMAGYFASHAVLGSTGVLARDEIRREKAELLQKQAQLTAREQEIRRNIALLDPRGVDPDYADELVRRHLGVVRPDEVIVPLTPAQ